MATTIKKYGNRRLYDGDESRYVTLEELADKIRGGADVRVVDAKTGADLTQATLAQIILESRGASRLLPVPLLTQFIRMGDEALAEFLGRYLSAALELYLQARQGAQSLAPYNPFATVPFAATNALARLFTAPVWQEPQPPHVSAPAAAAASAAAEELVRLRREMDELKRSVRKRRK